MKNTILLFATLLCISCQPTSETETKETAKENIVVKKEALFDFFLGTYTDGESQGIYKYQLGKDGKMQSIGLASKSDNPSFLAYSVDRKYLLAVNEVDSNEGSGTVESFEVKGDSLIFLSASSSGGAHPCHVNVNEAGYVLSSNYTGGNIGLLKLDERGKLSKLLFTEEHASKNQPKANAHSAWFYGDGNDVISVDLGTNELWFSRIDSAQRKLVQVPPYKLLISSNAGPRHLTFHPTRDWFYVINELNSSVTLVKKIDKGFQKIMSYSTLPKGYSEESFCADIHISQDGKFLYASNRGHNSIAIFQVAQGDGTLNLIHHEPVQGDWPRNFALSPDDGHLVVANQRSKNLVSFKRNAGTGLLEFVQNLEVPTPTCILF